MQLQDLERFPHRRARAQLLARGQEAAPHPAGGQPGRPAARGRAGRAAVRPLVARRHADRGGPAAPGLRPAAAAAGRRRPSRPCASCASARGRVLIGANEAAVHTLLPLIERFAQRPPADRASTSGACRRARSPPRCSRAASTSASLTFQPAERGPAVDRRSGSDELVLLVPPAHPLAARRQVSMEEVGRETGHRAQRSVAGARARAAAVRAAARADQHPDRAAEPRRHQARGGDEARRRAAAAPLRAHRDRARPAGRGHGARSSRAARQVRLVFRRGGELSHAAEAFLEVAQSRRRQRTATQAAGTAGRGQGRRSRPKSARLTSLITDQPVTYGSRAATASTSSNRSSSMPVASHVPSRNASRAPAAG